jgi:hypothetical protein
MLPSEQPRLTQGIDLIIPYRMIVAPFVRDARYFIWKSSFHPGDCKIVTDIRHIRGYDFRAQPGKPQNHGWEIWWLDGNWPVSTHADIRRREEMHAYLKHVQGADIRHWFT